MIGFKKNKSNLWPQIVTNTKIEIRMTIIIANKVRKTWVHQVTGHHQSMRKIIRKMVKSKIKEAADQDPIINNKIKTKRQTKDQIKKAQNQKVNHRAGKILKKTRKGAQKEKN